MCHMSRNTNSALEVTVQKSITGGFPMVSPNTIAGLHSPQQEQRQQSKMTFRMSPLRKVAKSARINLNRYWGILSQSTTSSSSKSCRSPSMCSSETIDYSVEMEQNRINELLQAQAAAAIIENRRNTEYENSPDFHQAPRRICYESCRRPTSFDSSTTSSPLASSSSLFIPCPSDDEFLDVISQDSVFL